VTGRLQKVKARTYVRMFENWVLRRIFVHKRKEVGRRLRTVRKGKL
jgi:hypothetical protein